MSLFSFGAKTASVLWIEPHRLHTESGDRGIHSSNGFPSEDELAQALTNLPPGPTQWIVDDLMAPSVLLREGVCLRHGQRSAALGPMHHALETVVFQQLDVKQVCHHSPVLPQCGILVALTPHAPRAQTGQLAAVHRPTRDARPSPAAWRPTCDCIRALLATLSA